MNDASPFMVKIEGRELVLKWDNSALFRADDIDLTARLAEGKFNYASLCKFLWVMLDGAARRRYPTPEALALHVPLAQATELWAVAFKAHAAGMGEGDTDAKKAGGGREPSPTSS